ncbi:MAG TPA: penicillin acylase family protein [Streptosporangiaceae bacterium]|nr:penicillin acylase family protein [Streptosporangiaceae bacterium]
MDHSGVPAGWGVPRLGGWVERPVRLYRDEWGIPHVRAHSAHDAFVGQGYAHAMDRFWQMDAARKQMEGRWAEWVGAAGLAADRLARRLRAASASVRDYQALGSEARAMVDAYAAGVNAWLRTHPAPFEYGLVASTPEPWEGWHCIAAMRQRGYLMGSVWFKLWRAAALGVVGPDAVSKLRYDDGGADRLCIPPGADASRWIASLTDLHEPIRALSLLAAGAETGGGSNNWALAPGRTTTGRPLLAGDPHRSFELPGMYAQMHLGCDQFDVIGLSIPGVPGFPHFAHNEAVAWCVTHANADIHDLYVEQFDPADPSRYRHKGAWLQAATATEEIKVRGADPAGVDVIETIHGPIVAGDPARGTAVTLKSVQFACLDRSFECLLPMMRADSVDSLFQAVRGWGLIDHNLVAADTGGHIGHLVRATVPRRPAVNGWLPVPGWTGDYEWDGMIPAAQMPRADDPPRGYLVTANNRVVTTVPGTGDYFCTDAQPPYRARRIEELIAGLGLASPQDMARIHRDDLSVPGQLFRGALVAVTPASANARAVRKVVLAWDGRMSPDSVGAAAYSRLRWALANIVASRSGLAAATNTELMAVPGGVSVVSHLWWVLPALLRSQDLTLTGGSTWNELLAEALDAIAMQAPDVPWQRQHSAALTHPLTLALPDAPTALSPAGAGVGGDNDTVWATGCRAESGPAAVYGAVARYVFDVGNWDNCSWIVVGGASGDPLSPHYTDQHEAWSRCELIPMRYDWDTIAAASPQLTLKPDDNPLTES